jgi:hypothetical protein
MTKKRTTVVPRELTATRRKREAERRRETIESTLKQIVGLLKDIKGDAYVPGERVWARWLKSDNWFEATVTKVLKKNLYLIRWDDGDRRDRCKTAATLSRTPP